MLDRPAWISLIIDWHSPCPVPRCVWILETCGQGNRKLDTETGYQGPRASGLVEINPRGNSAGSRKNNRFGRTGFGSRQTNVVPGRIF